MSSKSGPRATGTDGRNKFFIFLFLVQHFRDWFQASTDNRQQHQTQVFLVEVELLILYNSLYSLQYKFYLKILFAFHFMVLLVMWTKGDKITMVHYIGCILVGGELLFNELRIVRSVPDFWRRLDLPSAYPWEYVWCLSFLPIIFALLSFSRNKVKIFSAEIHSTLIFVWL
jgi:hypothetical protein